MPLAGMCKKLRTFKSFVLCMSEGFTSSTKRSVTSQVTSTGMLPCNVISSSLSALVTDLLSEKQWLLTCTGHSNNVLSVLRAAGNMKQLLRLRSLPDPHLHSLGRARHPRGFLQVPGWHPGYWPSG